MFKGFLKAVLTGGLLCAAVAFGAAASEAISIFTFEDLCKIGNEDGYPLNGHYRLMSDIDASTSREMNGGKGFEPIGTWNLPASGTFISSFSGAFYGNNYVIRGLYINRPDEHGVGLFKSLGPNSTLPDYYETPSDIQIRDLGVEVDTIIGKSDVGGLVGSSRWGSIVNCRVFGTVIATGHGVGGLAGSNHSSITNSYAVVNVSSLEQLTNCTDTPDNICPDPYPRADAGGLVGYNGGTIDSSYATGNVSGFKDAVGGLVGNNGRHIRRSYATGSASSTYGSAGGLAGFSSGGAIGDGRIDDCYATGSVRGSVYAGGLLGYIGCGFIANCYAAGAVNGVQRVGGIVGDVLCDYAICNISNSYWDSTTSGTNNGGECDNNGKATAEMKRRNTFANWNFTDIWRINEGETYPYFIWQDGPVVSITHSTRVVRNRSNSSMPQISVKGRTLNIKLSPSQQSSSQNLQIRVIDMRGRTVSSRIVDGGVSTLSLPRIPAGRYIVEVKKSGARVGSVPVVIW